jgi:hypothetical protein
MPVRSPARYADNECQAADRGGPHVPRSRDGSNDISISRALCDECNHGRFNADDTNFGIWILESCATRGWMDRLDETLR